MAWGTSRGLPREGQGSDGGVRQGQAGLRPLAFSSSARSFLPAQGKCPEAADHLPEGQIQQIGTRCFALHKDFFFLILLPPILTWDVFIFQNLNF